MSINDHAQLLLCPFCGSTPVVVEIEPHSHKGGIADFMPDHPGSAYIDCACGVGLIDASEQAVIDRWNMRQGAPITAQVERQPTPGETIRGIADFFDESIHHVWSNDEVADCLRGLADNADGSAPINGSSAPVEEKNAPGRTERMVTAAWDDSRAQAFEDCAKIADQIAINAERRAAGYAPAYNKMEGAQEVAHQIRARASAPIKGDSQ